VALSLCLRAGSSTQKRALQLVRPRRSHLAEAAGAGPPDGCLPNAEGAGRGGFEPAVRPRRPGYDPPAVLLAVWNQIIKGLTVSGRLCAIADRPPQLALWILGLDRRRASPVVDQGAAARLLAGGRACSSRLVFPAKSRQRGDCHARADCCAAPATRLPQRAARSDGLRLSLPGRSTCRPIAEIRLETGERLACAADGRGDSASRCLPG